MIVRTINSFTLTRYTYYHYFETSCIQNKLHRVFLLDKRLSVIRQTCDLNDIAISTFVCTEHSEFFIDKYESYIGSIWLYIYDKYIENVLTGGRNETLNRSDRKSQTT